MNNGTELRWIRGKDEWNESRGFVRKNNPHLIPQYCGIETTSPLIPQNCGIGEGLKQMKFLPYGEVVLRS